jgi:hypothetical protein
VDIHNLYSCAIIIRIIKSRRIRWAGHVARMVERRNAYRILMRKSEGRIPLGNQHVGGWTILKWILERSNWIWIGLIWLRLGTSRGLLL